MPPVRSGAIPVRFIVTQDRFPRVDASGFAFQPFGARPLDALLEPGVHLVVAPPAHGKTYVAQALADGCGPAKYVDLGGTPTPTWPSCFAADGGLWVLDAVDEAERIRPNTALDFLRAIPSTTTSSIVFFCRELEIPERLRAALAERGGREWRLVAITREEACRLLGASFNAVAVALTNPRLRGLAPHPRALLVLARLLGSSSSNQLDTRLVWRSVLEELLDENQGSRQLTTSREERFAAVARMAAMLMLTGYDDFCRGRGAVELEASSPTSASAPLHARPSPRLRSSPKARTFASARATSAIGSRHSGWSTSIWRTWRRSSVRPWALCSPQSICAVLRRQRSR